MRKKICTMVLNEKLFKEISYSSQSEYIQKYLNSKSNELVSIADNFKLNNIGVGLELSMKSIRFTFIAESDIDFDESEIAEEMVECFKDDLILIDEGLSTRIDCTSEIDEEYKLDFVEEYLSKLDDELDSGPSSDVEKEIYEKMKRIEEYYDL